MADRILITDTLYMSPAHHAKLRDLGFDIVHYEGPEATEDELCELIQDVDGYVLGGVEMVTERVVAAAKRLRGIAFCGSGWTEWIPAHESLTERGIPITTTAGSNAEAVSDFTILLVLAAARDLPNVWPIERSSPIRSVQARELTLLRVGVIGLGHIGALVVAKLQKLGVSVMPLNRAAMSDPHILEELATLDIIVVCANRAGGLGVLGAPQLSSLQDGTAIVNTAFSAAVEPDALLAELQSGRLRAFFDGPYDDRPDVNQYILHSPTQRAFITPETIERTSDWATESIVNLMQGIPDSRIVNLNKSASSRL